MAPKIEQITIDPSKIGDVVGQKGKTINEIIDRTGVKIDITDDGAVSVCGTDKEMIAKGNRHELRLSQLILSRDRSLREQL